MSNSVEVRDSVIRVAFELGRSERIADALGNHHRSGHKIASDRYPTDDELFEAFMQGWDAAAERGMSSSHSDAPDDFVAACGRGAWRSEQMCKVDPRRSPRTFSVLAACSDAQLKELMHVWPYPDERKKLVNKLCSELA